MHAHVGIIGGTGIGERLLARGGTAIHVPTPAGVMRGRIVEDGDLRVVVCGRHSAGHKVPPHRVNYAALAYGMKALGVKACLATAAVGSLRPEWGAGTFVACSDFFDLTGRSLTLFHTKVVHRDFTEPFGRLSREALRASAEAAGVPIENEGVYLCLNGPRYETPREIQLYRQLGADVVGMTASSEAILMREAEVDYGCLAIVTNLAAGISETALSHEEVVEEMRRSGEIAVDVLLRAARRLAGVA
jgi:5'-methylthioadenosine phosphorylase